MTDDHKPIVNPYVQLREEFDDWAVLFDCETGHGFGLNPTGVYIWKLLDGEHSIDDLLTALDQDALDVPVSAREHLITFLNELTEYGLAGDSPDRWPGALPCPRWPSEDTTDGRHVLRYEHPRLVHFTQASRAHGSQPCSPFGSIVTGEVCNTGHAAACSQGAHVGHACNANGLSPLSCSGGGGNVSPSCFPGSSG